MPFKPPKAQMAHGIGFDDARRYTFATLAFYVYRVSNISETFAQNKSSTHYSLLQMVSALVVNAFIISPIAV